MCYNQSMDYNKIERNVLASAASKKWKVIDAYRQLLFAEKSKLDFFMTRFLDDYGDRLETPGSPFEKFFKTITEEYSQVTRLIRVIDAYDRK